MRTASHPPLLSEGTGHLWGQGKDRKVGLREEGSQRRKPGAGLDPPPWASRLLAARPRGNACRERRLLRPVGSTMRMCLRAVRTV